MPGTLAKRPNGPLGPNIRRFRLAERPEHLHDRGMPPSDKAMPSEGETLVPVSVPDALDFPIPAACVPGFGMNVRLLEQHWTILRKTRDLIAASGGAA